MYVRASGRRTCTTIGASILGGYLVGDTSYGFTSNCRYLGGYQRVDIPIVRNWVLDCIADLVCPTKS